jgi:hypothetical protein
VHPDLRVGGPATAGNDWIAEFLDYCGKACVPPDFVSTHTYPTDALGSPGDDTEKALSQSRLGILRDHAEAVRKHAGERPLYYTEWNTSSNPRDGLHDDPYAAAYIVHTLLNMGTLVDGYSHWTFSDIFEENFFPTEPFHGGFGLMTIHGVPKPAYRAYEILHRLGEELLEVEGSHDTVSVWVVRGDDVVTVIIVNLALPRHPIEAQTVEVELSGLPAIADAWARRIDAEHANAKARWKLQGQPRYPNPEGVAELIEASKLRSEQVELQAHGGRHRFEIAVQPQSVTAVELRVAARPQRSSREPQPQIPASHAFDAADEKLLDGLQAAAFRYFLEYANPSNGLVADSDKRGCAASIAATGFALSCYPVAVERGWLSRKQAAQATQKTLEFFARSRQGEDARAAGYQGFYYHYLDMHTGGCARDCEVSTIDTALLLAGVMTATQYFDRADEAEIRALAERLFERVNWEWSLEKQNMEVNLAWHRGAGFEGNGWDSYSEALLMYVLGAATTSHPLPREVHARVARNYHWQHTAGKDWITAGPLFIHLFPQAWLDLRGLDDGYVGARGDFDYFRNTQHAIFVQRVYAHLNPHGFAGYGKDIWGLSACAGPHGKRETRNGDKREFLGYAARGVPAGPDDGTLVPWAAAACLAHEPEMALAGLRAMLEKYPGALRNGKFVDAINPTLPGEGTSGWIAPACSGIDQGLVVMMIENARSGLI